MESTELKSTISLSSIFALRMLGLFMILPIFSLYAEEFSGSTAALAGLAIGIYGLSQALFQLPFGFLSDRFGRKPLILCGLALFALGGLIAAQADSIVGVIIGRGLQGSGAIAAVVMALLADLTKEENRTKAMAMIGMSIGLSFSVAILLGPFLGGVFGIRAIFLLTSLFAVLAMFVCVYWVPNPTRTHVHRDALPAKNQLRGLLKHVELMRLNAGIFILHLVVTASFVVLPLALRDFANVEAKNHWMVYLPIMGASFVGMVPLMIASEKKQRTKQVFLFSIALLCGSLLVLAGCYELRWGLFLGLLAFFFGFNLLEALMPSLVSKIAPAGNKGTAMGIYSTAQFFGAFIGGASGGFVYGSWGMGAVFIMLSCFCLLWIWAAWPMSAPKFLHGYMIKLTSEVASQQGIKEKLQTIEGVEEVLVIAAENAAYLKVDKSHFDEQAAREISLAGG